MTREKNNQAFVLPLVLTVIGCLVLFWAAYFALAQTALRLVGVEAARRQAYWSARAGALRGLARVRRTPAFGTRTIRLSSRDEQLAYRVTVSMHPTYADIRSTGEARGQSAECRWRVTAAPVPPGRSGHGLPWPPVRFVPR